MEVKKMNPCPNCGNPVTGPICQNCGFNVAQMPQQQYQQPYQQPYQRPPPRPLPGKATAALVFAIITLIMLIIAGAVGWWSMSMEADIETNWYSMSSDYQFDFTFEEIIYDMRSTTDGDSDSQDGDENLDGDMEDVGGLTGLIFTLGIVMVIIVIVLLIILLMIGYTRSPGMSMYTRLFKNLTLLFTFLALIFVLIAPIYYMVAWPAAVEDDLGSIPAVGSSDEEIYDGSFMGSKSITEQGSSIDVNWGPGIGWILAFVCLILLIITLGLVKTGGDEVMRMAPATQPMPQQQYGGYGPQQPGQYQPPPQYPPPQPPPQYP
jgi:hypothetical protein